jgi:hypothetical protein
MNSALPTSPTPSRDGRLHARLYRLGWWLVGTLGLVLVALAVDALWRLSATMRWVLGLGWVIGAVVGLRLVLRPIPTATRPHPPWPLALGVLLAIACVSALALEPGVRRAALRWAMPWQPTAAKPSYQLAVNPGDAVVGRGRPLTIAVHLSAANLYTIALPSSATLHCTDARGQVQRLPMQSDQRGVYHARLDAVGEPFEYFVELGTQKSPTYRIRVAELIEAVGPGPSVTVTPPAYAAARRASESVEGFVDLSALQHSLLRYRLRLTQPAATARLEWQPRLSGTAEAGAAGVEPPLRLPVALGEDRHSLHFDWPLTGDGTLRIVVESDEGIRSDFPRINLTAMPDRPPEFVQVNGLPGQGEIAAQPDELLVLQGKVRDDIAVADLHLEYQRNNDPPQLTNIPLPPPTTPEPMREFRYPFKLAGRVQVGDTLRLRLRVRDNRNVPSEKLGQQSAYYPSDNRWAELRIVEQAEPVREQTVISQANELNRRLDGFAKGLAALSIPDAPTGEALVMLRVELQSYANAIREAAKETAITPGQAELARKMRAIAEGELAAAVAALQPQSLTLARQQLSQAVSKFRTLHVASRELGHARLDQVRLRALASRVQKLADRLAQPAALPPQDALAEQTALVLRLNEIIDRSPMLKPALAAARQRDLRSAAEALQYWALTADDLLIGEPPTRAALMVKQVEPLIDQFAQAISEWQRLAQQARLPARAARTGELTSRAVPELIGQLRLGRSADVLLTFEQLQRDLSRLADDLERAVAASTDWHEAALQAARLQETLRQDCLKAKGNVHERDTLHRYQRELAEYVGTIAGTRASPVALAVRQQAVDHAQAAAKALAADQLDDAERDMQRVCDSLERFAKLVPTLRERFATARTELAQMLTQQEAIRPVVEAFARGEDRDKGKARFVEATRKQAELLQRLAKLDVPVAPERTRRCASALAAAHYDLTSHATADIPASQAEARRELERLSQALLGVRTTDERLTELHAQQTALVAEARRLIADPPTERLRLADWLRKQQELAFTVKALPLSEAPLRFAEAVEAFRRASEPVTRLADALAAAEQAAETLGKVIDQLANPDPPQAAVQRLAQQLTVAIDEVKKGRPATTGLDVSRRFRGIFDELKLLRVGPTGQNSKQKALEALSKLVLAPQPDKALALQERAAEALRELIEQASPQHLPRQAAPSQTPDLPAILPNPRIVAACRETAVRFEQLRGRYVEALAKPLPAAQPKAGLVLVSLARQQQQLADQLPEQDPARTTALTAARLLLAGRCREAFEAARLCHAQLGLRAELAEREAELLPHLLDEVDNPTAQYARQRARRSELIAGLATTREQLAALAGEQPDQPELTDRFNQLARTLDGLIPRLHRLPATGEAVRRELTTIRLTLEQAHAELLSVVPKTTPSSVSPFALAKVAQLRQLSQQWRGAIQQAGERPAQVHTLERIAEQIQLLAQRLPHQADVD